MVAYDEAQTVGLHFFSVGRRHLYVTVQEAEVDIWVWMRRWGGRAARDLNRSLSARDLGPAAFANAHAYPSNPAVGILYLCTECAKERGLSFNGMAIGSAGTDVPPPAP